MKKLGLIGGTGPAATVQYYSEIIERARKRLPEGHIPKIVIDSIDCGEVFDFCRKQDFGGLAEYLLRAIVNLKNAGADFAVFTGMTPHRVFKEVAARSPLPLVSLIEPCAVNALPAGINRIFMVGSKTTMENEFAKAPFTAKGIEVIIPSPEERDFIQRITEEEIEFGKRTPENVSALKRLILSGAGAAEAQAVFLANTDLPAYFKGEEFSLPVLDPVEIHMEAIIEAMMS